MKYRRVVIATLVALSGCGTVLVDVSSRHPTPRPLWAHPVASLKTYQTRPAGGVAVYGLQASGEDAADVEAAVREKAASLGCDGIMFTVREDQGKSEGVALTGKLNDAREYVGAHIDALCMVDPAAIPEGCPTVARPEPGAATTAPVDADGAIRAMLEQWRQAYEGRSSEALAKLYVHDASLRVVEDGAAVHGWTAFELALRDRPGKATAIHVRFEDIQVHTVGATGFIIATLLRDRSDATSTVTDKGVVTLVLRAAEPGNETGWVIVAEHTSYRRS